MALIACLECKNGVSTEAKTCPHCGAKVRKPSTPNPRWRWYALAFVVVCVLAAMAKQGDPSTTHVKTAEEKKQDAQAVIAMMAAKDLKDSMKDPASFKLVSLVVKPDGAACYEYRAQNSFGANLPGYAVLSKLGNIFVQERNKEFTDTWNTECTPAGGREVADLVNRSGTLN